ncbi:MAG: hypothetical protein WCK64_05965 [Synechococcaceae cyanobacterium ELA445]
MAHTSPVELACLIRQGVALFFMCMISAELPGATGSPREAGVIERHP